KCLDWGKCARFGPCKPSSTTMTCAESSVSSDNGMPINSDVMDVYSCDPTLAHGPEKAFSFIPDQSGGITISMSDPPSFLNIYLIEDKGDGCSSNTCIAFDHKHVQANVEAGKSYWIVVDATENKNAGFYLELDCDWYP
ncbi:MAG: hypothetical protein GXP54_04420, partial [Deltaproteobacteria bacterium]|nr:hypothetical protein [Deltaproteobacteria bacterium]